MRYWLLIFICILNLQATELNKLIEVALAKHPSLETIKARIAAADYALSYSKNFDNPIINISVNDIRLDDLTDRSLEPMQTQAITLSQKIPWFGKIDAKVKIEKTKKKLLLMTLKEAKAELVSKIKITAYQLWEIEELIKLTQRNIEITEQNIKIFQGYTASSRSENFHMGIMSAELVRSRLKTDLSNLKAKREEIVALLSYLSFQNIQNIKIELPKETLLPLTILKKELKETPILKVKQTNSEIEKNRLELSQLNRISDPTLRIGYNHRQEFEDFVSVGLSFALPIYGTEKSKVEEQRAKLLSKEFMVTDTKHSLEANLEKLYAIAQKELEVLHIVKDDSLPLIEHMFDLIRADIAAGGDLYKFMDLIEQKLTLEAQAISARANFHKTKAKIDALLGELK
ncbi:TolC family protein [Hydrogenimonas thermophila]|uniref:TolC family protein n=1 Tax=Hydrogenimonas thermophila TaxID=223786 RepID=UPI002936DB10|nr:TolC family protein [Hydrogenimonas thermophila]WOE70795.1 TolC family protein [Hydrogenimonas thermophila]WOE73313.1 TolC family protein [Hydrogenimonas thermophila]